MPGRINVAVALAYLSVVLIWSTTPLAIKWSGEGPGFLFGASARMAIGGCCVWLLLLLLRQRLPSDRKSLLAYAGAAIHIYGSMLAVYWGAQFIPSGWVAVIFGLTPMMTALMAAFWLAERGALLPRLTAYGLGIGGLLLMIESAAEIGPQSLKGIVGVLLSAFLQASSSIWVKRVHAPLPSLQLLGGGLALAVPAYLATWWVADGQWPQQVPSASLISIAYLGAVATTVGFACYFYVLKHLAATRVALITLATPLTALALGHLANREPISIQVFAGAGLILFALFIHEFSGRRRGL